MVKIATMYNYLDDMLGVHQNEEIALKQSRFVNTRLKQLTLAAQEGKERGPARSIDLLGKNYNTVTQIVRLTTKKFHRYSQRVIWLMQQQNASKRIFLEIIGKLRFAGTIYRTFNAFIRGIERWTITVNNLEEKIIIHAAIIRDLSTALKMLKLAHERGAPFSSFRHRLHKDSQFDMTIYTDASLTIGVGGICSNGTYFQNK